MPKRASLIVKPFNGVPTNVFNGYVATETDIHINYAPAELSVAEIPKALRVRKYATVQGFFDSLASNPLRAGDHVEFPDGVLNLAVAKTITQSGTKENPIVIKATNNQKTILTGKMIHRRGKFVYFWGFDIRWDADTECRVDGDDCQDFHVRYNLKNIFGTSSDWLNINGARFIFNRPTFQKKTEQGAMLVVNGVGCRAFYPLFAECGTKRTPNEAFRVGSSGAANTRFDFEMIYPVFYKIGAPGGEDECATLKGEDIRIINPVLIDCDSALTLRHGKDNLIKDAISISSVSGKDAGGVRVYGKNTVDGLQIIDDAGNHQLVHGLTLGSGDVTVNPPGSDATYEQVQGGTYRRIIIVQKVPTTDVLISLGDTKRLLHPKNNKLEKIIVVADYGTMTKKFGTAKWEDNQISEVILFGKASKGDMPTSLYQNVDPKVELGADGLYHFTALSTIKWPETARMLKVSDVGVFSGASKPKKLVLDVTPLNEVRRNVFEGFVESEADVGLLFTDEDLQAPVVTIDPVIAVAKGNVVTFTGGVTDNNDYSSGIAKGELWKNDTLAGVVILDAVAGKWSAQHTFNEGGSFKMQARFYDSANNIGDSNVITVNVTGDLPVPPATIKKLDVYSVKTSADDGTNFGGNTIDGNLNGDTSRWSGQGVGTTIRHDIKMADIKELKVAFYKGHERTTTFGVHVLNMDNVLESAGTFTSKITPRQGNLDVLQIFKLPASKKGKAIQLTLKSVSDNRVWFSITELETYGVPIDVVPNPNVDESAPELTIDNIPVAGLVLPSGTTTFTIKGKSFDNVGVQSLAVQVNGGVFQSIPDILDEFEYPLSGLVNNMAYDLVIRARDSAGNFIEVPRKISVAKPIIILEPNVRIDKNGIDVLSFLEKALVNDNVKLEIIEEEFEPVKNFNSNGSQRLDFKVGKRNKVIAFFCKPKVGTADNEEIAAKMNGGRHSSSAVADADVVDVGVTNMIGKRRRKRAEKDHPVYKSWTTSICNYGDRRGKMDGYACAHLVLPNGTIALIDGMIGSLDANGIPDNKYTIGENSRMSCAEYMTYLKSCDIPWVCKSPQNRCESAQDSFRVDEQNQADWVSGSAYKYPTRKVLRITAR